MAERFRFRLPWLTNVTPRPAAGPESPVPPAATLSAPSRPSANIPVQRPPFRPAGIAPVQPSAPAPQTQSPKLAEPQPTPSASAKETNAGAQNAAPVQAPTTEPATLPQSPPRAATESRVNSQPPSPARTAPQPRAASLPPSPSRNARQPRSPSRLTSQRAGQANSLPPSPSRRASNVQTTAPQARSPVPNSQPTEMVTMQLPPPSISDPPQSPVSDQGEKPQTNPDVPSESLNQEEPGQASEPEIATSVQRTTLQPRSPVPDSQHTAKEIQQLPSSPVSAPSRSPPSDQGEKLQANPDAPSESVKQEEPAQQLDPEITAIPAVAELEAPQKSNSEVGADLPATVRDVVEEEKDTNGDNTVEEEFTREGKATSSIVDYKQKEPSADAKPSADAPQSTIQAQMPPNAVSRSEQKPLEKKDTRGRKKHTSGLDTEHVRTVRSTYSKANHLPSGSQQNHIMHTGDQTPLYKEIQDDISRFVHKLGTGLPNQPGETPVSVVTLAGENRGAFMHLGSEPSKKDGPIHIYRGYKTNPDESTGATTTDAEDNRQDNRSKDPNTREEPPITAHVNSNAQSINNSMVLGSLISEGSPGVWMAYSYSPAEQAPANANLPPPTTHKAQVNVTRPEKLTHEPTVRRRCLRGLFSEPSDSDPDNPKKPRRHGCRYACGQKNTDTDIGII